MVLRRQRRERQPQLVVDQAHLGQRPFDRDRVRFDEELAVQRHQPRIVHSRAATTSPVSAAAHISDIGFRRDVRGDRDHAVAAEQHERQRRVVVARSTRAKSRARAGNRLQQLDCRDRGRPSHP